MCPVAPVGPTIPVAPVAPLDAMVRCLVTGRGCYSRWGHISGWVAVFVPTRSLHTTTTNNRAGDETRFCAGTDSGPDLLIARDGKNGRALLGSLDVLSCTWHHGHTHISNLAVKILGCTVLRRLVPLIAECAHTQLFEYGERVVIAMENHPESGELAAEVSQARAGPRGDNLSNNKTIDG